LQHARHAACDALVIGKRAAARRVLFALQAAGAKAVVALLVGAAAKPGLVNRPAAAKAWPKDRIGERQDRAGIAIGDCPFGVRLDGNREVA
jgi:hypothetical protein